MAKQSGLYKLQGKIDGVTGYKRLGVDLVRTKGGVSAARIAGDPAFARTRENNSDLGTSAKAGKTLRNAARLVIGKAADANMVGRLAARMLKAVQQDVTNARGSRTFADGNPLLVAGFNFNVASIFGSKVLAAITATMNRVTGVMVTTVPAIDPSTDLVPPPGATKFEIIAQAMELDTANGLFNADKQTTGLQPLNAPYAGTALTSNLTANSTLTELIVLGVRWYTPDGIGGDLPLLNGRFDAVTVFKVSV